jgi:hypothetical protein
MSHRRNSYKKLRKIVRLGKDLDDLVYVKTLTSAQQQRLIFWTLTLPE